MVLTINASGMVVLLNSKIRLIEFSFKEIHCQEIISGVEYEAKAIDIRPPNEATITELITILFDDLKIKINTEAAKGSESRINTM